MKSRQLLSVVFSLIMFAGVTTGNAAFAESDLDNILEDYCKMSIEEQDAIIIDYDLGDYAEKLATICEIEDDDERRDSLNDVIDAISLETRDDTENYDESDYAIKDFKDCVDAGNPVMESFPEQCMTEDGQVFVNDDDYRYDNRDNYRHDLNDILANFCEMTEDETAAFFADYPRLEQFSERLAEYCDLSDYAKDSKLKDFIRNHVTDEDRDYVKDKLSDYSNKGHGNLQEHMAKYCDLTEEERADKMQMHPDMPDDLREKLANYCEMSEDEQAEFRTSMMDRMDDFKDHMKDKRDHMDYKKDMREHLDRYCDMTDEEQAAFVEEHDKAADHVEKMNRYCTLDETDREIFIQEHKDEYIAHMKDKMHDKMTDKKHMDYDRLCSMTSSERAAEITDVAKLDRISDWCNMTPDEREDYKKEHHDEMKDKMHDKVMDKQHDKMKMSDKSDRLKAMIMYKRDISDDRAEEIKMKYKEKHGDLSDERKSELKMKFKDHMKSMKIKISDERKSEIKDRLAEMKAFKAELRQRASEMTDEEKQQLREEFIDKARDMQLAWISPRVQMTAGVDSEEVECREGFSLVMKASNGVAMCLKADTALKMIDRGLAVPAN